jgi:hypothetical protein
MSFTRVTRSNALTRDACWRKSLRPALIIKPIHGSMSFATPQSKHPEASLGGGNPINMGAPTDKGISFLKNQAAASSVSAPGV